MATACFVIAAVVFVLMGVDVIDKPGKNDDYFELTTGIVAVGLAFLAAGFGSRFFWDRS